ncbi:hypothetical protein KFK09_019297 [Dendrobium nobile]|uniref:Uncharacterized protein n=1 Tax=Dendrobium nobile TaxID=94219 RepID=A0A8T3AXN4_DENNO|nr:hypothetical protein KFK09_019297 [Dendrobium nobile]
MPKKPASEWRMSESEETEEDRKPENDEPNNVDEKEGLAGYEAVSAIADLARTVLGHSHPCTSRIRAAAPVRHAVLAADGVGSEAFHGAELVAVVWDHAWAVVSMSG